MEFLYKKFNELDNFQLQDIFRLRQKVFIIEQNCLYEDIDGADSSANHLMIYQNGRLAAYLRLFPAGTKFKEECSLGRIAVHPDFRGRQLGRSLILRGIELCRNKPARIEAQAALTEYYHQYGFIEEGEVYLVDGIKHIQMLRPVD